MDDDSQITINREHNLFITVIDSIYSNVFQWMNRNYRQMNLRRFNNNSFRHYIYNESFMDLPLSIERLPIERNQYLTSYSVKVDDGNIISGDTLFVDLNNNIIPQTKLIGKEIKFIQLVHIVGILVRNEQCRLQIRLKSPVVTSF